MRSFLSVAAGCFLIWSALFGSGSAFAAGAVPVDQAREDAVLRLVDRSLTVFSVNKPLRLILVAKDIQRLFVVEHDGVSPRILVQYVCASGANEGNKELRGDEKTPEGVYFITKVYTDSKVTVFGRRAFHLDYPNYFDQEAQRGGDGIFIHGTNRELRSKSTNGCVTLENKDLDQLARYLQRDAVPVIIVPTLDVAADAGFTALDTLIGPVKAFLLPNGVERERVDFDTLYMVQACGQSVAVSEFVNAAADSNSDARGYSRSYLRCTPSSGWVTAQWVWHPASRPLQTARVTTPAPRRVILY